MNMELLRKWVMGARVALGMLVVQLIATGLQLLSRIVLNDRTFVFALITYRHLVGAICIAPFALYCERGVVNKLSFVVFFWVFLIALTGIIMGMGLFYYGLKDTTAAYATNFLNLIPIVTFLFSTILRIERLGLETRAGKIRNLGVMLCLGGALTVALYTGKSFYINDHIQHHLKIMMDKAKENRTRGTIFLVTSCLSYAMWFILQVKLFRVFPYKYWATMIMCITASMQAAVIGVCINRKREAWYLAWNLQLLAIFYSGILATGATFCLISWTIAQRGPTYPSMFNPLSLILIAILEALFLGEPITVGSMIGMSLIIVGLYFFLWGKSAETKLYQPEHSIKPESGGGESAEYSNTVVPTASPNPIVNKHNLITK